MPECQSAQTCTIRDTCPYARIFEPAPLGEGPSGLSDWPRPFVFRANHLDGLTILTGQSFYFDVNLFDVRDPLIESFATTFAQIGREGLGPGRSCALLTGVDREPSILDLNPLVEPVHGVRVKFVAPTELKHGHQLASRPDFPILMSRVRDRLSTLSSLYGEGPLPLDFAAFGQRSEHVTMTGCELQQVAVSRISSRTGQRHSLGGFVGTAEYEGDLREFIPFLIAAQFTGVGRQTTWGKGEIEVQSRVLC